MRNLKEGGNERFQFFISIFKLEEGRETFEDSNLKISKIRKTQPNILFLLKRDPS